MVTTETKRDVNPPRHPANAEADRYWQEFERIGKRAHEPAWVLAARKGGISHFAELGFPTVKDEDWRFTNVAPIARLPFKPLFEPVPAGVTSDALDRLPFAGLTGSRLVFVDGRFVAALSSVARLPQGSKVMSLAVALATDTSLVEEHLFRHARADANAFAALNTAFFQDGAFIHLPAGQQITAPVRVIHISTSQESGATVHPRNLIVAGSGSQLTVIESYVSLGGNGGETLTNAVTELVAGEGAIVEHLKLQDEDPRAFHLASIAAHFGRASNVVTHSIALGARLSRTNIHARLAGEGVECVLNGLYVTRGEQLADHFMLVEHARPHGTSHEYFNGILADRSKGVFHGRILVQPGAQKTDAKQTNKNLLLSDDATVNSKPQLEIYADDVKCTHGATVGQLSDEAIFYLRTRGLPLEKARHMLIHAFAGEIIDRIRCEPVHEELNQLVWERLELSPNV